MVRVGSALSSRKKSLPGSRSPASEDELWDAVGLEAMLSL